MKTAVAICLDANYLEPAAVFLESFSENYHYRYGVDLICVMPEEDAHAFSELESMVQLDLKLTLKLVKVSKNKFSWLKELYVLDKHFPASVWHRLFLGSILEDYDKVIYFDTDILIVDDVQPIFNYPMYGKLMAVYDANIGLPYLYNVHRGHISHFISGMFIADLNWWRDSGIEKKFEEDIKQNGPHELMDEYLLNKYAIADWHALPTTFNFCFFNFDAYGVPNWDSSGLPLHFKHAIAIHYAGPIKPWNFNEIAGTDTSRLGAEWRRRRDEIVNRNPRDINHEGLPVED